MGVKVFGRREGVPYYVTTAAGIEDQVFVMADTTGTSARAAKLATAGATVFDGLIGVVQTGVWHGQYGTAASLYPQGADINVVSNGQVRVKLVDPANGSGITDGSLVTVGANGKLLKYTKPTIALNPTITANYGTTDVGALITAAVVATPIGTADLGAIITANAGTFGNPNAPTAAEIKTYMELVIELHQVALATQEKAFLEAVTEALIAAEAVLSKAYIAEVVLDNITEYDTEGPTVNNGVVGRCIGEPVSGVAAIELIGLGGIQQG